MVADFAGRMVNGRLKGGSTALLPLIRRLPYECLPGRLRGRNRLLVFKSLLVIAAANVTRAINHSRSDGAAGIGRGERRMVAGLFGAQPPHAAVLSGPACRSVSE